MRWVFILLLVVNVVYLGWELNRETAIRQKQTGSILPVPASAQRLQLLSEMSTPPSPRTVVNDTDEIVATSPVPEPETGPGLVTDLPEIQFPEPGTIIASYTCFRFGPILDEEPIQSL